MKNLVGKETATIKDRSRYFQQGHIQEEGGGNLGALKGLPAFWCKHLTHWQSPWCWRRLRAEGEEDDRGWDGWMASSMQWTSTWANSRRWWGMEKPGMLQSMRSPRVRHNWVTEYKCLPNWKAAYWPLPGRNWRKSVWKLWTVLTVCMDIWGRDKLGNNGELLWQQFRCVCVCMCMCVCMRESEKEKEKERESTS